MIPAFVVRSVDGEVRAYTEKGERLDLPREVVEAWSASVQVIEMRDEPTQAETAIALNELDRVRRRGCRCDEMGWVTYLLSRRAGQEVKFHRPECPVSVAYREVKEAACTA